MTDVQKVDSLAWIDVKLIHGNADNPRRSVGDVTELALSIREQGLLQPIVVAPDNVAGGYVVLAGHRRLAALEQLRSPRALCLIRFPKNSTEAIALMLVENGQRVAVTPMEEARAMQRLIDAGMSQVDIARKIGRTPAHVSTRVALVHLSPEDQDAVDRGILSVGEATAIGRRKRNAPKGKGERPGMRGWHFGHDHPLADQAAALCSDSTHSNHRRIGAGACGECWEQAIRNDERDRASDQKEAS